MKAAHLIWSALWRAQVSHLAVFAVVPLLAAIAHAALGVMFLPFLSVGFGDGSVARGTQAFPLREPACWLMLAPCVIADSTVAPLPFIAPTSDRTAVTASGVTVEPFLSVPTDLTVRHVWFVFWLTWFMGHLVRRERRLRAASRAPGTAPP